METGRDASNGSVRLSSERRLTMRSLFLSAVLGVGALGLLASTPADAQARPWRAWSGSYYYPSTSYYYPSYSYGYYPSYSSGYYPSYSYPAPTYSYPGYSAYYTPGYTSY